MVNNPLKNVAGNIEICCSEMTENPLKNFQHLLTLVHLMFPYQYLIILIFNLFGDLEKLGCTVWIIAQKSQFSTSLVNWEKSGSPAWNNILKSQFSTFCKLKKKLKYSLRPIFQNPNFESMNELGKKRKFTTIVSVWALIPT